MVEHKITLKLSENQITRRANILSVARQIITEEGSEALNMKEVARRADVPRATLYRYYTSRDHLMTDLALEWGHSLLQRLQSRAMVGHTLGDRITSVLESILIEAVENPNLIAVTLSSLVSRDAAAVAMQADIEQLLPKMFNAVFDQEALADSPQILDVMHRLLLGSLFLLSSGRDQLDMALHNLTYTARSLLGETLWTQKQ